MNLSARKCAPHRAMILIGTLACIWNFSPTQSYAQKSPVVAAVPADQENSAIDAQRGAFDRFLDSHPELQGDIMNYPPTINDPKYAREHPELQAFLDSHPLVKADPRAFLSSEVWRERNRGPSNSRADLFLSYLVPATVFLCALLAALSVFRALLENRRWSRSMKVHEEVHAKLIEKFASGQDFSAYLQSEAGRRLLEWTPPAVSISSQNAPTAVNRIIWSAQAGIVLLSMGFGLITLRGHLGPSATPPLLVFGTLGITLGIGFALSALVSYVLSRHLGLVEVQGQPLAAQTERRAD